MPEREETEAQRSWRIRMDSVIRQFNKLSQEDLIEESSGNMVRIIGLCITHGKTRLTVLPIDTPGNMYATDVEELSL
jgi:carbonic anhydrase